MREKEKKLSMFRSVDFCFGCGKSGQEVRIGSDHYFPQTMEQRPRKLAVRKNPIHKVVRSPLNIFKLCDDCHEGIDIGKINAFEGSKGKDYADPVALVKFLRVNYPITHDPLYRMLQMGVLVEVNRMFAQTAFGLNGELPKWMKWRYQSAAVEALATVGQLSLLIDLERIQLLKYLY